MFNVTVGDRFTMRQLRKALGDKSGPNSDEHFNRRFRSLRKYKWVILSSRDLGDLKQDEYRLERAGHPIWLGKSRFSKRTLSEKLRRQVMDRDGNRCILCGIGSGEPYPDQPDRKARLTIGHVQAEALQGTAHAANLRTECSRCNEPLREEAANTPSAAEIWPRLRGLPKRDKARILRWIERGQRDRDAVDLLYDQIRVLPEPQRAQLKNKIKHATSGD
jgi:hypothetical protein